MRKLKQRIYNFITELWNLSAEGTSAVMAVGYFLILLAIGVTTHFLLGEQSFIDNPDGFRTSYAVQILLVLLWLYYFISLLIGGKSKLENEYLNS